ncbi:MAG: hypothetical protein RLZZ546_3241 [Bacteroidota bacterium]|jgi:ubiquinone/menaquinone biosynthesis C-methylase UbiE
MDKGYFKDYYFLERSHWWFLGRLEILISILKLKVIEENQSKLSILNVGVATGATSIALQQYGNVTSVEYDRECCDFLTEKVKMEVLNASMTALPFEDQSFDIVCAFDVIEHIEDDLQALKEAFRVLKTNGKLYITVPMYMSLWSDHDVINHHYRRYSSKGLTDVVLKSGFEIRYKSFFNSILFPPIFLVRLLSSLRKKKQGDLPKSDFDGVNTNKFINQLLLQVLKIERRMLSLGLQFGFGVSKMIVGKKVIS